MGVYIFKGELGVYYSRRVTGLFIKEGEDLGLLVEGSWSFRGYRGRFGMDSVIEGNVIAKRG